MTAAQSKLFHAKFESRSGDLKHGREVNLEPQKRKCVQSLTGPANYLQYESSFVCSLVPFYPGSLQGRTGVQWKSLSESLAQLVSFCLTQNVTQNGTAPERSVRSSPICQHSVLLTAIVQEMEHKSQQLHLTTQKPLKLALKNVFTTRGETSPYFKATVKNRRSALF